MQAVQKPGVIINMGSAAGLYPMYGDPIYSASKGLCYVLLNAIGCSLKTFCQFNFVFNSNVSMHAMDT